MVSDSPLKATCSAMSFELARWRDLLARLRFLWLFGLGWIALYANAVWSTVAFRCDLGEPRNLDGVIFVASESLGSAYRLTNEGVAQLVELTEGTGGAGSLSVPSYTAPSYERLTRLQGMIRHDASWR